jgi:acetyl esterase/lipase
MKHLRRQRELLKWLGAALVAVFMLPFLQSEEKFNKQTYTFKTVDKCEIKADVYRAPGEGVRPVVVWIHGGALITGQRGGIDGRLRDLLLKDGYVVMSIDYRLAPETKLPGILEDVQDAFRWVREQGPKLFQIDPNKLAVMGGSAGGYLTLTTGYRIEPKPRALVAYWGYGDLVGEWYSRPDSFYRKQPLVSKEEAYQAVGGPPLSEPPANNRRGRFYLYCRQNGLWPKEVVGLDPDKDNKAFDPFCPVRNVTAKYPPTLLIHGTKDTDVPYAQSEMMAKELKQKGVEHELITVTDAGHGLSGAKPEEVMKIHQRVVAFVNEKMR